MMSLEINKLTDGVTDCAKLYLDIKGLEELEKILITLKAKKTDHVDLFSEAWGGSGDMLGVPRDPENQSIQYLKIMLVQELGDS
jgi:hypothetical protein